MSDLKQDLSFALLNNGAALICRSKNNEDDFSVEIGIQNHKGENEWLGRHHVTSYDLYATKDEVVEQFDITQHEFSDEIANLGAMVSERGDVIVRVGFSWIFFDKRDGIAIAKALGVTAEDLK